MNAADIKKELAEATTSDSRGALVVARDPTADKLFCYSVRTPGVYCRPSCAARLARPENARFEPR
jgi:AraC family transcriptional regulator of adaptative response/methylated-DNA-[protein]-cysteine methyltransferase